MYHICEPIIFFTHYFNIVNDSFLISKKCYRFKGLVSIVCVYWRPYIKITQMWQRLSFKYSFLGYQKDTVQNLFNDSLCFQKECEDTYKDRVSYNYLFGKCVVSFMCSAPCSWTTTCYIHSYSPIVTLIVPALLLLPSIHLQLLPFSIIA